MSSSPPSSGPIGGADVAPVPSTVAFACVQFIIVTAVFTGMATVMVLTRFLTCLKTKKPWFDDWLSLAALVCTYGLLVSVILICTIGHAGYDMGRYSYRQLEVFSQIDLAINVLYETEVALCKLSLLVFYYRIFSVKKYKTVFWILFSCVIATWISAWCRLIFADSPVDAQWLVWKPHSSIKLKASWIAGGIINTCWDFLILSLPQFYVWRLQLALKRKILISLLFLIGLFACASSIVRLYYMATLDMANSTKTFVNPGIWTVVEANLGIICGCGPMLPAFFKHWFNVSHLHIFSAQGISDYLNSSWLRPLRHRMSSRGSAGSSPPASDWHNTEKPILGGGAGSGTNSGLDSGVQSQMHSGRTSREETGVDVI